MKHLDPWLPPATRDSVDALWRLMETGGADKIHLELMMVHAMLLGNSLNPAELEQVKVDNLRGLKILMARRHARK